MCINDSLTTNRRNYQPFSDHSENEEASHESVLIHVVPENKCKF
jgi:hypothetical protein